MDSHEGGMSQGTNGAPTSSSAFTGSVVDAQPTFPAPPDIPPNEPVISRIIDILTHPTNIPHYIAHLRGAKWSTIIWLVLGLGILESVVTSVSAQVSGSSTGNASGLGQRPSGWQAVFDAAARLSGSHGNLLTAVVSFVAVAGIYWLLAKLFGGQGTFLQTSWLVALIAVPINAMATLLGLIPVVGLVAITVLSIYQVVMTIFAMAAAHRLTVGKSMVVVIIPLALELALLVIIFAVLLMASA
jgi:hypothetical protein